ncbi:MAG: response regulator [Candidatus Omnitrophica bacterium]|nr:response regulator [Candidatus Omnitrophota bacterium]
MKNLLIIENDEDNLSLIKEILEDNGYNVLGTAHLENGLDILQRGIPLQLILLSTVFDGVERFDAIERVKKDETNASVPIIALTSSERTNEGGKALEKGCFSFLHRPIEEEALLEAVKNVLEKKE